MASKYKLCHYGYKLIFPTDTLQQKIEITDLKPFLAAENTSVIIILTCKSPAKTM